MEMVTKAFATEIDDMRWPYTRIKLCAGSPWKVVDGIGMYCLICGRDLSLKKDSTSDLKKDSTCDVSKGKKQLQNEKDLGSGMKERNCL